MKLLSKFNSKGFSLVELAVSLAIIGMIVSSVMSVAITNDFEVKKSETEAKLNRIEEAIAGFLSLNLRLPCPADGETPVSDASFGQEGTIPVSPSHAACPNRNFNTSEQDIGVVPVSTLQLPDDFMFDGWGRRIMYAVDRRLAHNQITNEGCLTANDDCFIALLNNSLANDITINHTSGGLLTSDAAYVLISYGENGHGAYPKNGGSTRINGYHAGNPYRDDADAELRNAHLDIDGGYTTPFDRIFVNGPYRRVDDKSSSAVREYFDDILRFKEKHLLVKAAGGVIYDPICFTATEVVNKPGNNECTGVIAEDACEAFAIEIYKRCLQ
jgi:prepilin-type N-terminal cleavage/methylation domain-containing protein